eukprot:4320499-Pleurochrysis_carterae.AAC.1
MAVFSKVRASPCMSARACMFDCQRLRALRASVAAAPCSLAVRELAPHGGSSGDWAQGCRLHGLLGRVGELAHGEGSRAAEGPGRAQRALPVQGVPDHLAGGGARAQAQCEGQKYGGAAG